MFDLIIRKIPIIKFDTEFSGRLRKQRSYSDRHMPWLDGVWLEHNQLDSILSRMAFLDLYTVLLRAYQDSMYDMSFNSGDLISMCLKEMKDGNKFKSSQKVAFAKSILKSVFNDWCYDKFYTDLFTVLKTHDYDCKITVELLREQPRILSLIFDIKGENDKGSVDAILIHHHDFRNGTIKTFGEITSREKYHGSVRAIFDDVKSFLNVLIKVRDEMLRYIDRRKAIFKIIDSRDCSSVNYKRATTQSNYLNYIRSSPRYSMF